MDSKTLDLSKIGRITDISTVRTDVTMDELAQEFPEKVIAVLRLLTHEEGVPYFDYVRKIKANPIAVKIKLADIAHNTDPTRSISPDDLFAAQKRWDEKYSKALQILK